MNREIYIRKRNIAIYRNRKSRKGFLFFLRSFELEQKAERFQQLLKLPEALSSLADADRELIESLYFKGMSTRECASLSGISQRALIKRRDRILNVLKKIYKNFLKMGIHL